MTSGRQRGAAVEHADVVEPEEAALEHVFARAVLAVHPPGEVEEELMVGRLEELEVDRTVQGLLGAGEIQGGPGVYRRVHVAEVPLVGRDLTVGVEVVPGEHKIELLLSEVG